MNAISPVENPTRIKAAFMGSFAVALVVLLGGFAAAIYLIEASVRNRDLDERSAAVASLFALKLEKDGILMRAVVLAMMGDAGLADAFRRGERSELERQGRGIFETLRSDLRITHLYFTRPDRINLYRFHSPSAHGDVIDRVTMLQAHGRKQAVHGLELGPLGTLTLRLVMPWRQNGRDLGYVEIGEEIEHLIDEVRDALAVDLVVLVDKRHVRPQQWRRGQDMMRREGDWQRFSTHVALAQTAGRIPEALDDRILARLLNGSRVQVEDRGKSLHLASVPLNDAGGHHIGELAIMRDVTALESTFHGYMIAVAVLSLGVAAAALTVFYFALRRVEGGYRRQHELEHRLLRLNTEHERILQLEKLSALGTMVGGIAHQLNNPLVGVVNMAQLAQREAEDPARTRELLAEIRSAGEDCRGFVRRMLEFSKVSRFDSKSTALLPLIEDTVLMFRQSEQRHLPVEVLAPEVPPVLKVDPILIRHALFNLLLNAAQATEGNAGITIRLEVQPHPDSGAAGWSLSVADRGRGIAPEAMDKIFVPFFTTRADGTGLGLPVVLHVALLHNGYVTAGNRPGGGTQFAIWLPR